MCLEQVLCLIAPYPFFNGVKYNEWNGNWNINTEYELNQILMCLSFSRVYILMRWHLFCTNFMNPRSNRLCMMNGCEAGHMFALKSIMKQRPYTFLFYTLVLTIVLFGYQLKVFEGPLSEASNQNFNLMGNAMWNVIITLTTTGFGDIYPKSFFGRVIGLIICFWGTFMVSFFVVTVNNMLTFSPSEEKSFNLL
jgi:Ion channel